MPLAGKDERKGQPMEYIEIVLQVVVIQPSVSNAINDRWSQLFSLGQQQNRMRNKGIKRIKHACLSGGKGDKERRKFICLIPIFFSKEVW